MTESKEQNDGGSGNTNSGKADTPSRNWITILFYIYLHIFGLVGLYVLLAKIKWITLWYFLALVIFSYTGLTAGAHRLYAHQTFTAASQLRFFLVLAHTMAGVGPVYDWVLWHRLHHKYHNTDEDPFDHRKGFLYSHVFSNFQSTSSNVQLKNIDMRDVGSDRIVWVQQKFYWILFIVLTFLLPIYVSVEYCGESFVNSVLVIGATRVMITTHIAWLVNSALLIWGLKKGDRFPVSDNNSVFFVTQSYWPNYHYVIPWDWRNDEFGPYERGFSTFMIKMWYEMGLIEKMMTTTTKDIREILEKIAVSKVPIKEAFEQLKKKSEEDACRQKLVYYP
ncbi:PREDICTED: acyl-CoA desaturase [Dinoponera quadriceps]|uniref:Acyl-CoA desaturase n=1 Tax=Dinoponera quadriceps TaxID=609295 RepID=A0A6P3X168_DINQU|nr:PREDICTED: acyl-CoA desaturase [Dinoponera quadriceps]XP_014472090.1 PREDICTED: acyl-CoA desaturase [Dinoponera quadriceps]